MYNQSYERKDSIQVLAKIGRNVYSLLTFFVKLHTDLVNFMLVKFFKKDLTIFIKRQKNVHVL